MLNQILIIVAIAAFLLYLFSRIKAIRLKDSLEKKILESRAQLALGATLIAISVILLLLSNFTAIQIVIGGIFLLFGIANTTHGARAHKHYTAQLD
ncbi:YtpI family protein [Shouchella miscanthi]|uniref:YtpI family protein n=1 Tax=Shouchella miscanthi TaxID=2598861 RepID=UPI0011A46BD8|nr:YtpI family protein [Shouchella miscanthi]